MKYDVRLKAIFQEAMPGLLKVLGLPAVREYLTIEFPTHERELPDLVILLVDGLILHIELQTDNDPRIVRRCLGYWQAIDEKWPKTPIHQVVIYMGSAG